MKTWLLKWVVWVTLGTRVDALGLVFKLWHTTLHTHTRTHSCNDTHVRTRTHARAHTHNWMVRMCWIDYMDTLMENLSLWSRPGY